jgi:membrane fusion protein, heavy metal efflux system
MKKKLLRHVPLTVGLLLLVCAIAAGASREGRERLADWRSFFTGAEREGGVLDIPLDEAAQEEERHALALTTQALRNIGLDDASIFTAELAPYQKTVSFPAIVVERPSWSSVKVPAPGTGVVTQLFRQPGEVVKAGEPLFTIALNHEELIDGQAALVASYLQLDIINLELERLEPIADSVAPRSSREFRFRKSEIESEIEAKRTLLSLHGISDEQIDQVIREERAVIREMTVYAPEMNSPEVHAACCEAEETPFLLESLDVEKGQQVSIGESLCSISDYACLYIEGQAFASDVGMVDQALSDEAIVRAVFEERGDAMETVNDLSIRYVGHEIDLQSRTLGFFVDLPNRFSIIPREGAEYLNWRFKPGQRCRLEIPYETIDQCFVLPVKSVAFENNEAYVFEWSGEDEGRRIWLKRSVHVLHRTPTEIAIANDGAIFPGSVLAGSGAGQLLVALTSGGGQLQSTCPCPEH